MITIEALKVWAEFEPERCKWTETEYYSCYEAWLLDEWEAVSDYHIEGVEPRVSPFEHITIEAAVREAILARGWGFKLTNVFEPRSGDSPAIELTFTAEIFVSEEGEYADEIYYDQADTPAEALLDTYLRILQRDVGKDDE